MNERQLRLLLEIGMAKEAGIISRGVTKAITAPAAIAEKAFIQTPLDILFGRRGKGAFKGTRWRPRKHSPWKSVDAEDYKRLKAAGYPAMRKDGKYLVQAARPGGAAGFALKHPILTGAGALMLPEVLRRERPTPSAAAYGALRRHVAPMAPELPEGYKL